MAAVVPVADAQTLKPGLWEVAPQRTAKEMEELRAATANRTAQVRETMESIRRSAAQQGVYLGPDGNSTLVCMTRDMIERNMNPMAEGDCRTRQSQSGNVVTTSFACTNPTYSGETQVTIVSSESYIMKSVVGGNPAMDALGVSGRTVTANWRGADCGLVKPPAE